MISHYKNTGPPIGRMNLRFQLCLRFISTATGTANDSFIVDGDCIYSKSVTESQRVVYTLGVSKECHSRLNIKFVDIVPAGTRLYGGIRPSTFAYIEGTNGKTQLSMPEAIDYGEVVAINTDVKDNPDSAVMPQGYLVQIDAGEVDEEDEQT